MHVRDRAAGDYSMWSAARNAFQFQDELATEAGKMQALLGFLCQPRLSDAPGRLVAEERLLECLEDTAAAIANSVTEQGLPFLPGFTASCDLPEEPPRESLRMLRLLHDFAMDCFNFKRPRDSFGGRRRAHAFAILACIARVVNLLEALALARNALSKPKSVEARLAADFLFDYLEHRDATPDDDLVEELLHLAEVTDSRSTVFAALDGLIRAGIISEFEALDRMSDWKERQRNRN